MVHQWSVKKKPRLILLFFFGTDLFLSLYAGGSLEMFMTDDQKKYYAAMKKMGNKKPVKATPRPKVTFISGPVLIYFPLMLSEQWAFFRPLKVVAMLAFWDIPFSSLLQWKPQAIVFGIVTNKKFDMIIMLFIALNMITMTLDRYQQPEMWNFALDNLNMGFIVIFTSECILKIFALRQYYFKEPWNVFDFVVVILSILGIIDITLHLNTCV